MLLYLLVEGYTDQLFIEKVLKPHLSVPVMVLSYAQKSSDYLRRLLRSLRSMLEQGLADYYALMDMDDRPCYTACHQYLRERFGSELTPDRIFVANRCIEAWYLAGYTGSPYLKRKGIKLPTQSEGLRKVDFRNAAINAGLDPTVVRSGILANYDLVQARQRSPSLDYCCRKLGIP
jgi:hypothetical protein